MSASDSHPMADWPPDLLRLSNKFALSGEVDGQHPPDSMIEAYLLVAEVRTKRLSGIPWGDGTHDFADDEDELAAVGQILTVHRSPSSTGRTGHVMVPVMGRVMAPAMGIYQRFRVGSRHPVRWHLLVGAFSSNSREEVRCTPVCAYWGTGTGATRGRSSFCS